MGGAVLGALISAMVAAPPLPLITGNGHGFQLFDREQHRVKAFLEHPYRYVAPTDATRKAGVARRQLAHDMYFGVRIGGVTTWLHDLSNASYEDQSNVIRATSAVKGATVETFTFAPFGFVGNAVVLLVRVTPAEPADVTLFAKVNLHLGSGRPDPGEEGEIVVRDGDRLVETGPGGGHAIVAPLGGADAFGCGDDASIYAAIAGGGHVTDATTCQGTAMVAIIEKSANLATSLTWGVAVLFVNDDPDHPQAPLFKDPATVGEVTQAWTAFVAGRSAEALHADALAEWQSWRSTKAPAGLTGAERSVWRQSEAVLRMAQVRESKTSLRSNRGMVLAALPPGEWHIGWVRDATYAAVALAALGHEAEARAAIEFMLGTEGGFFGKPGWLEKPYRVSATRYFGNGMEEGDYNEDGPNIETDGWGLVLWAARQVVEASCDVAWLDAKTWKGDSVYEALASVAADIEAHISDGLPEADASIWEVHWERRQVFTFTAAAQARGLLDFAAIADARGDVVRAKAAREAGEAMRAAIAAKLVHAGGGLVSHLGVASAEAYVDGSAIEALSFGVVDEAVAAATLADFTRLETPLGGYRRLEPSLSLTGGAAAGTYDLAEWLMLDLRASDAWRRAGDVAKADALLAKVTSVAAANDGLVPELLDPADGHATGAIPMVGYGAGAWILSVLQRHGWALPAAGAPLSCGAPPVADEPASAEPPGAVEAVVPPEPPPALAEPALAEPPPSMLGSSSSGGCAAGKDGGGAMWLVFLLLIMAWRP